MQPRPRQLLIRSFSTTQIARLMAPGASLASSLGLLCFALTLQPLLAFGLFFVLLAIGIAVARRPQQQLVAIARHLHQTLRWFDAATATRVDAEQLDALRAALPPPHAIVTVPCAAMQRIDELAAALAERFRNLRWPEDPARKAAAVLAEGALRARRPLVVVLQDADALAARDGDGFARFLTAWELRMQQVVPPVLLFVHGAPYPPRVAPATPAASTAAEAPSAVAGGDGAWWQRHPGELAD